MHIQVIATNKWRKFNEFEFLRVYQGGKIMQRRIKKRIVAVVLSVMFALNMGSLMAAAEEITGEETVAAEDADGSEVSISADGTTNREPEVPGENVDDNTDDILGTVDEGSVSLEENVSKEPDMAKEARLGKIEITDYNLGKGTFRVVVSELSDADKIKKVEIPVWSAVNGQDDINWYQAKRDIDGSYYADVDIKDHKYSMGVYNIHVYVMDITNKTSFAGKTEHKVEVEEGELTVTKNSDKEYTVELKNVKVPGGIAGVEFPTWSAVNGQDDISWYKASKVSDDVYRYKISVGNHKGLGEYNIHAYVKSPNGSLTCVGTTGFI